MSSFSLSCVTFFSLRSLCPVTACSARTLSLCQSCGCQLLSVHTSIGTSGSMLPVPQDWNMLRSSLWGRSFFPAPFSLVSSYHCPPVSNRPSLLFISCISRRSLFSLSPSHAVWVSLFGWVVAGRCLRFIRSTRIPAMLSCPSPLLLYFLLVHCVM
eukprot:RCo050228